MPWTIAPTNEFMGVWNPLDDCSDQRVYGCLEPLSETSMMVNMCCRSSAVFRGWRRMRSSSAKTRSNPLALCPTSAGTMDCVVVPSKVEELKYSRCCTV